MRTQRSAAQGSPDALAEPDPRSNQKDGLPGEIESLTALDVPACNEIINAHHVRSRLGVVLAVLLIAAGEFILLCADHPAHGIRAFLPAMRTDQLLLLGLFFFGIQAFIVH